MSIHYKNGNSLQEFASKVSCDDASGVLTINGVGHPLATKTWVLNQGYISSIDDQWTERINLLDSMLS